MNGEAAARARARRPRPRDWTQIAEKGTGGSVRLVAWLCATCGRGVARAVMRGVALYYLIVDADLRRASRELHRRLGLPAGPRALYRHVRTFAFCACDRIFLLRGDQQHFRFGRRGAEHTARLRDTGRGAILLGAHLGSFEALRAAAGDDALDLSIVADLSNSARLSAVLAALDPGLAERVIERGPDDALAMLTVRERVREGGIVAFMGDRVPPGAASVEVDFLGGRARLPTGVFQVAARLGCPVLLAFGLYRDPNHYEVHCEPFAERIELGRRPAPQDVLPLVQRYARRLEHYVKLAPHNWFNFYDFWMREDEGG